MSFQKIGSQRVRIVSVISFALGLTALVAAVVVGWRALRLRRLEAAQPGRTEASAIPITDYGEIDESIQRQRCHCGGQFILRGEGSRHTLRVAHIECQTCGRERILYFDVRDVRH